MKFFKRSLKVLVLLLGFLPFFNSGKAVEALPEKDDGVSSFKERVDNLRKESSDLQEFLSKEDKTGNLQWLNWGNWGNWCNWNNWNKPWYNFNNWCNW